MGKRAARVCKRKRRRRIKTVVTGLLLLLASMALFFLTVENDMPFRVNVAQQAVLAVEEVLTNDTGIIEMPELISLPRSAANKSAAYAERDRIRLSAPVATEVENPINTVESAPGYAAVMINNRFVLAMKDADEAQRVIAAVLDDGKKPALGGKVQLVKSEESVDILTQQDKPEMLYSFDEAYLKLSTGGNDMKGYLTLTTKEAVVVTEDIKYETETIEDKDLKKGDKKTIQKGKSGKREIEYLVTLENGKEISRSIKADKIIKKPVNEIIVKGTKVTSSSSSSSSNGKPGPNEGEKGPSAGSLKFSYPVSGRISSNFGMRWGRMHYGIDIPMPEGSPIKASESGTVSYSGERGDYGLLVEIDHGNGFTTRYGHNSKNNVVKGQKVSKGDVIALIGNTGNSSTSHVHFEVRCKNTAYNPLQYLP